MAKTLEKLTNHAAAADARLELAAQGMATIPEAMQFLKISRAALYSLMDGGVLPYGKIGRSRRVPLAALKSYAAGCLIGG